MFPKPCPGTGQFQELGYQGRKHVAHRKTKKLTAPELINQQLALQLINQERALELINKQPALELIN